MSKSKARIQPGSDVIGVTDNEPRGEFFTAAAIIGGASLTYKVGHDLIPKLKAQEPILITIEDSRFISFDTRIYRVIFRFRNVSMNGVYLEEMKLKKPKGTKARFAAGSRSPNESQMGLSATDRTDLEERIVRGTDHKVFSHLLAPNTATFVWVEFKADLARSFWRNPFGTVDVKLSPLISKKAGVFTSVNFLMRER